MRKHASTILALAALALAGCSDGADNSTNEPSEPKTYDAPSDAWDNSGTPMPSATPTQQPNPFTLSDNLKFTATEGATGTISFNTIPPQDLEQALQWAGKSGGTWASIHIDNREGSEAISNVSATLLDDDGSKYELVEDGSGAASLYGNSDSSDPHMDDYYDLYEKYDSKPGDIEVGEVRDFYLYSTKPLPNKVARGTIDGNGLASVPLAIDQ
jgi:hypothetical protein